MCVRIFGSRRFSRVLTAGHSRMMRRQFLPMFSSLPGCGIGMIIVLCHSSGIFSQEIERFKMLVRWLMAP